MSPLVLALLVAQTAWPVTDPDLPAAAFADPDRWPDDPDYGPGEACEGAFALYGFVPPCAAAAEPEVAAGLAVDRAWAITTGDPGVTLALAGSGVDLTDPDLVARYALNPGELPLPDVGVPTVRHDVNGDGAFTVLDYTSATGTVAPTVDRILDRQLLAREDRGDVNGNGWLDPADLLAIFSDGRDGDDDGYVDDIVGWDFLDDDNDPSAPEGTEGPAHAARAAATGNNGIGGIGACPRCTVLATRVASHGLAGADRVAVALLYASRRGAPVFALPAAAFGARPLLDAALDLAAGRGTLVIASAGLSGDGVAPTAWPDQRVLVVGGVGPDAPDLAAATRFVAPDACAGVGHADLVAPSRCDRGGPALVAGVAGLVVAAARGAGPELAPLEPGLTAGELWAVLTGATDDLAAPGWDARTGLGRLDARAAVERVVQRRVPPHGRIVEPAPGAVLDPSGGGPAGIRVIVSRSRHEAVAWTVSAALGDAPPPEAFEQLEAGQLEPGGARTFAAALPLLGWREDPTSPEGARITLQVQLQSDGSDAVVLRRVVSIHRDLHAWPGYPVSLGAGVTGGVRVAPLEPGDPDRIVVASTDGRVHALDAEGQPVEGFPVMGPGLDWFALGGHPNVPTVSGGALPEAPAASLLAPVSVGAVGGETLLVTVTADGRTVAFGPRGAVQAGFPAPDTRPALARSPMAPAGITAPVALGADAIFAPAQDHLRIVAPDGSVRAELRLPDPPSAVAVRGEDAWFTTRDALTRIRTTDGAVTRTVDLQPASGVEGRAFAIRAAPVLFDLDGAVRVAVAPVGGALVELTRGGAPLTRPGRITRPGLAVARLGPGAPWIVGAVAVDDDPRRGAWRARRPRVGEGRAVVDAAHALAEPTIADVDADGRPELVYGDDLGLVHAVNLDGREARTFPKVVGEALAGAPAVGDLDGDGRPDLVAVTRRGRVWAWRLAVAGAPPAAWSSPRADARSRGDAAARAAAPAPEAEGGCRTGGPTGRGALFAVLVLALARAQGFSRRRRAC